LSAGSFTNELLETFEISLILPLKSQEIFKSPALNGLKTLIFKRFGKVSMSSMLDYRVKQNFDTLFISSQLFHAARLGLSWRALP
jgi:hypothetical protein